MEKAHPFLIDVAQPVLDDLALRLRATRWSSMLSGSGWSFGTDGSYLRELVSYWQSGFDWRDQEARLNRLPQFKAPIGDANIHFVHVRGRGPSPMPLLLLHGWPDSFCRFHKVVGPLADPASSGGDPSDAFDVVIPSLPGFAFTGPVRLPASQPTRHGAELLWRLMTDVLGYRRFAVAGGDGGSHMAQILAIDHPEAIAGIHLTDVSWHAYNVDPETLSRTEQKYLEGSKKAWQADGAYQLVHTNQPRSLAAGLNDSPVGLASWIVDRFHSWCDGQLDERFGKDELLTNIMLYWVTQTISSSVFNYYADRRSPSLTAADHVDLPVALALFPKDIGGVPPRSFAERTLNVQRWTEMPRGGHFAALEEPELFARDVIAFFRSLRSVQSQPSRENSHVHPTL